jgi:hypothetical protein
MEALVCEQPLGCPQYRGSGVLLLRFTFAWCVVHFSISRRGSAAQLPPLILSGLTDLSGLLDYVITDML